MFWMCIITFLLKIREKNVFLELCTSLMPFRADKPVVMEIYWNFHTQGIRNVKTGKKPVLC